MLVNPIIRAEAPPSYFPLGLATVAGALLAAGHDVEVLDINANRWVPAEVRERLRQARFDLLGLTGLITTYNQIKWLASTAKSFHPNKKVVLGGGVASSVPELILADSAVDIAVIGEGEDTAVDLADAIERGRPLEHVPGIAFHQDGQFRLNTPRALIEDLDTLPPPAWHLFPVDKYARGEKIGFEFPLRALNLISSRGCPYRCSYCFHGIFGHQYRTRSPQKVAEEVLHLKDRWHLNGVLFSDDTFTLKRAWVEEFCRLLQQSRSGIKWACNGRVNTVDLELLKLMKQSGCHSICYGIESGSQQILDDIQKGVTVDQASLAVRWSREAGLEVQGYFMIGSPEETPQTVRETVDFCKRTGLNLAFGIATPLPGTEWLNVAVQSGKVPDLPGLVAQWACWNDSIVANLTSMSDEELIALKHNAEQVVGQALRKKKSPIAKIRRWGTFGDRFGPGPLAAKVFWAILRSTGVGLDPYSRMNHRADETLRQWGDIVAGLKHPATPTGDPQPFGGEAETWR